MIVAPRRETGGPDDERPARWTSRAARVLQGRGSARSRVALRRRRPADERHADVREHRAPAEHRASHAGARYLAAAEAPDLREPHLGGRVTRPQARARGAV